MCKKTIYYKKPLDKLILFRGLVLSLCICFSSCQTSKNIDAQKQVDYSGDFKRIESMVESLRTDISKQTKITSDRLSNLKVENKTVILSPPDSTGRQYPMQESTTTASKDEKENIQVDETITLTVQQLTTLVDSLTDKVDILLKQKDKVIELSWWDLHKDKVYCGIIILLAISGWIMYKKK